ncbi:MAG: hypothetical protein ABI615_02225 [Chthoniobacterales bacterium]
MRYKAWITPICMAVMLLFAVQAALERLEHAGFIECCSHESPVGDKGDEAAIPACCICYCDAAFALPIHTALLTGNLIYKEWQFFTANESCPDGPVRAIDYPPQLS